MTPAQKIDLCKGLVCVSCCFILTLVDTSMIYHIIRAQAVLKLYIFFNMLEVYKFWFKRAIRLFSAILLPTVLEVERKTCFFLDCWQVVGFRWARYFRRTILDSDRNKKAKSEKTFWPLCPFVLGHHLCLYPFLNQIICRLSLGLSLIRIN